VSMRIADEREQRRGLILGLTLAEILLLLLFLLLLAFSAKLQRVKHDADDANVKLARLSLSLEQLRPLQAALLGAGASGITSVEQLAIRFQHMAEVEQENARLKQDNASLSQVSDLTKTLGLEASDKLKSLALSMTMASKINPNDPPAALKRALDVLEKLGSTTKPEDVRPLSEMKSTFDAVAKLTTLEAQRDKLQEDVNNLMRVGNGLTYPSCWKKKPSGQTEYIFDITFYDSGIIVSDATPGRSKDPAWSMVSNLSRGKMISEQSFITATSRLADWSKRPEQNCRFYVIERDATGNDKQRYVRLRQTIESSFYPSLRAPIAVATPAAPAQPTPIVPTEPFVTQQN
jgi:hypothetical protein